ncbi:MAG: SusC/RagA family TonB-linked outer membrane protein [Bacteroidota bacterium]
MKKLLLVSLCFLVLCMTQVFAQNRTVTGTVTAKDDGLPIPGVTVKIKGTNIGTPTDANGKYSISASSGTTLEFSFIGFTTQSVVVGNRNTINIALVISSSQLGEVIVTGALGLTRTRNQQAYAAQQITGDESSKTRNSNFLSGLSGKIAGLEVKQGNALGGSTNIVLRGNKSIANSNQALIVVDGVPFDNSSVSVGTQATGRGGYDYGSPASDINPDDIESTTVLKGPGGSALYGSRGANGVILITTKKAKRGLGIVVNSSVSQGSMDKTTFPTYQTKYGAGYGPTYGDINPATGNPDYWWYRTVNGVPNQRVVPLDADGSLGARFDPNLLVYQSDAFDPFSPNFGKATPWVAHANAASVFIKPISTNNSIFITNGTETSSFKLGYTRNNENGIMPNSNVLKNTVDFGGSYNIAKNLTAAANINFTRTDGRGRFGSGYQAENLLQSMRQWLQTNVDYEQQKDRYYASGGRNATWNPTSESNPRAIFWDNPYFVRFQNFETDTRNRYFGNVSLSYKILPWLTLLGRTTLDNYSQFEEERRQVGTTGVSGYTRRNIAYNEVNHDFLLSADKNIISDLNFKGLLGANIRKQNVQQIASATNGGLVVPGIYALTNSVSAVVAPTESYTRREVDGIFAGATFTYKNMLVLDGTIRRDVSSTLPIANNEYYYPSVNLGFTFSELLKNYTWLSYGKARIGYSQVGADAPVYSVFDTYAFNSSLFGSATQAAVSTSKNNLFLKPEQNKSIEGGLEMQFFDSRLGFDVTYYKSKLIDQIIPVTVSTATGYNSFVLNSGTVENKGLEISINATPLKTQDFSWTINLNYTRNRNVVVDLFKDAAGNSAKNLQIASLQGGVSINATLNEPMGQIRGKDFIYTNGQRTVGADGFYLQTTTTNNNIGNVNPNYLAGINNSFSYKNWKIQFLIDIKNGGNVFSLDTYYGMDTGLYPETAGVNDKGVETRTDVAAGGGVKFPGVNAAGQPNTAYADNTGTTNSSAFGYGHNPQRAFVYDASYIKLREALVAYSIPDKVVKSLANGAIKGIDLGVSGRNLWIIKKYVPYSDPEEFLNSGNTQGYQSGAFPTTRTFTFNVKLRF